MNVADWELTKAAVDWRKEDRQCQLSDGNKFVCVDALLASHGSNLAEVSINSYPRDLDTAWYSICARDHVVELDITCGMIAKLEIHGNKSIP